MTREEELLDLIDKANELIATQDRIINQQEESIRKLEIIVKSHERIKQKQDDIIKLLQLRIEELIGESEI